MQKKKWKARLRLGQLNQKRLDYKNAIAELKTIYSQGVEPKIFLNDFLEILYYIKNISSIKLDGTNFSLNDKEFREIESISKEINPEILLLFWQFTIKSLEELDIVSDQNLSIEMFLIRLMYLKEQKIYNSLKNSDLNFDKELSNIGKTEEIKFSIEDDNKEIKNKTISQIKNFSQEETLKPETKIEASSKISEIKNFEELINLCNQKKELKLKYELETNVSLVSFTDQRIEISFNENLDKDFVKELTFKLYEWTGQRWIIAFSKEIGQLSKKQKLEIKKSKIIEDAKSEDVYKKVLESFHDAELVDVKLKDNK